MEHTPARASLPTFLALLLLVAALFLWMCSPYLLAIFMGEVLSLLVAPLYRRLKSRLSARLASAISTTAVLILVIAPFGLMGGLAVHEGAALGRQLAENGEAGERLSRIVAKTGGWSTRLAGDPAAVKRQMREALQSGGKAASMAALAVARGVPKAVLQLALALISCYFFLLQEGRWPRKLLSRLPLEPDLRTDLLEAIETTALSTLWAGLAAATSQAALVLVGFLLLGMPAAFLAAGATFLFAWLPMIGIIPVTVVGAAYLIWQHSMGKLAGLALTAFAAGLVDNFVRPMVLKGDDRLHPLLSLVSIFGGIQLFGIFGVFVGPVLAAVLASLYDVWPAIARRHGFAVDSDPQ